MEYLRWRSMSLTCLDSRSDIHAGVEHSAEAGYFEEPVQRTVRFISMTRKIAAGASLIKGCVPFLN
jgi:hypothetical protein